MNIKNEKGIISLFAIFSMIFLLVFAITSYLFVREKIKIKEKENMEFEKIYLEAGQNNYASSNEIIPIYTINQLNLVGTGDYLKINDKIYQLGRGMSYILKDDIIVDINEDLQTGNIGFNDYKLSSETYYIDIFSHELKYFKDGAYWKALIYRKFDKQNNEENNYSILEEYEIPDNSTFMMLWGSNKKLDNYEISTNSNNNINSINDIDVYINNFNKLDKENGEFYIFILIGNL